MIVIRNEGLHSFLPWFNPTRLIVYILSGITILSSFGIGIFGSKLYNQGLGFEYPTSPDFKYYIISGGGTYLSLGLNAIISSIRFMYTIYSIKETSERDFWGNWFTDHDGFRFTIVLSSSLFIIYCVFAVLIFGPSDVLSLGYCKIQII
jgi:hypothetical protein